MRIFTSLPFRSFHILLLWLHSFLVVLLYSMGIALCLLASSESQTNLVRMENERTGLGIGTTVARRLSGRSHGPEAKRTVEGV